MDFRFVSFAVATLTTMNIMMTMYLTDYIYQKVPFDMDIIRSEYVKEMRYAMRMACLHGTEFTEVQVPWGGPYPVDYCNEFISDKEEYMYEQMGKLGLKKRNR